MHHWIDHTAIHQVGRCIDGRGQCADLSSAETEISGLLQLATQLVFVDKVSFSGFEASGVADRSAEIIASVERCGAQNIFSEGCFDVQRFEGACRNAVAKFAIDTQSSPNFSSSAQRESIAQLARPDIRGTLKDFQTEAHYILTAEKFPPADLISIEQQIIAENRSNGADLFMTAVLRSEHEELRRTLIAPKWFKDDTARLLVRLRYYLKQELASHSSAVYAPAVARARIVGTNTISLLSTIDEEFRKVVTELMPSHTGIPSIAGALAKKAKGDPKALIAEAIAAREPAKKFRNALKQFSLKEAGLTSSEWFKAQVFIKEHMQALRQDLGIEPRPTFTEAFSVDVFSASVSEQGSSFKPLKVNVHDWEKWWQFRKQRPRISFLSEFAHVHADQRITSDVFKALVRGCSDDSRF